MVTINIMPNVFLLEMPSHMVKLLTGSVLEGMMNGNIEKPAVKMMPAIAMLLNTNAVRSFWNLALNSANDIPAKPAIGASIIHGYVW